MDIQARADALRSDIKKLHKHEAVGLLNAQWRGKVTAQQNAVGRVKFARKLHLDLVDMALQPVPGNSEIEAASDGFCALHLDIAESILREGNSTENRIEKLKEYRGGLRDKRSELRSLAGNVAQGSAGLKHFTSAVKKLTKFFKELTTNALKYKQIAIDFVTGKTQAFLVRHISKATGKAVGFVASRLGKSLPNPEEIAALRSYLWTVHGTDAAEPGKWIKLLDDIVESRWFRYGVTLLETVTVFFSEMAEKGSWGNAVAKATFAGALTFAMLSADAAIAAAVGSTLNAAAGVASGVLSFASGLVGGGAISVPVPPVAIALVAAGVVIAASYGLYKLFDVVVESMFGKINIPPSMRLPMSTSMAATMSSSMMSRMSSSMLPE